ncbi:MAG: hypothetical protein V3V02_01635 [Rhizobiaceae bacterium]
MKTNSNINAIAVLTIAVVLSLQKLLLNGALETAIGQWKCGDSYLQPVGGVVGDISCGFNLDMTVSALVILLLLIGLALIVSTKVRAKALKG